MFIRVQQQSMRGVLAALCMVSSVACGLASKTNRDVDPYHVQRSVSWGTQRFEVVSSRDELTITTNNETYLDTIDGVITGVEVGDLNRDSYPEILVYVSSVGSGGYGSVVGYSSNGGKSMSRITTTLATEDPKYMDGYMGHDKFSIQEGAFIQTFPVYREGDTNSSPTGPMREIRYGLVDGEASRKLVVEKIVERP